MRRGFLPGETEGLTIDELEEEETTTTSPLISFSNFVWENNIIVRSFCQILLSVL